MSCTYKRESKLQHANHVTLSLKNANPASNKVGYKQVLFISHKYNQVNYLNLHFRPPVKVPSVFLPRYSTTTSNTSWQERCHFILIFQTSNPRLFFKGASTTIVLESGHPTHPKKKLTRKKLSSQNLKILIRVGGSLPTSSFQCNFFQTPKRKGGGWCREGNMINVISFFDV